MKYFIAAVFLVILFNSYSFSQTNYSNQSIEGILNLPEDEINIGIASLVLAKEFYPNLNVQFFLQAFDYMADRYKYYYGKYNNPDDRIGALNTYLYKPGFWNDSITFCYDDDDLQVTKLENKFINGYISSKKGSCITMPMLYVILGERLGFPIYPVRSAKHFFVRYVPEKPNNKFRQNIETTNGGGYFSNKQYKEDVLLPDKAIKNGVYLRTLTKKEYIASLLLINANEYIRQKNIEKAKHYLQLAIKYDSTFSSAYWNYGLTAFSEARQLEEELWEEKQNLISQNEFYSDIMRNKSNVENKIPKSTSKQKNEQIETIPHIYELHYDKDNAEYKIPNQIEKTEQIKNDNSTMYQAELQHELNELEKRYEPLIMEKIKIYREYTRKAEQLGIVHEFPLRFFQKQIESINKFKKQGGY